MPRVIACGCSNTYGHGLKDITDNFGKMYMPLRGPSKLAWPQLLADKLGYECVNLSMPASSNKLISYKLTDQKIEKDDVVVFLWTFLLRTCILKEIDPSETLNERVIYLHKASRKDESKKAAQSWVKWQAKYGTDYDLLNENMVWVSAANRYAERFTNNVYNYSINGGELFPLQDRYSVNIIEDFGKKVYNMPKALDRSHPGEEAHQEMANIIYNNIVKDNK